ncbi:SRPBCC family protein [Chitinophaga sp. 22321]|uniref:SRPBCC domain-containing protein n=1 Tax=Chitinophaga hostae TaxID=2831022 RepID=A0ABS5J148_9BACT|nr:SRPBCC domain-containing protein [Chitinophaga hostae]MBS0028292.1 SRPBCC domain-containing protein [Chitinophaga hostae]
MKNQIIEKTVEINAAVKAVWSVFTNPEVTKQMGGYYGTDWKTGSSFGFRKSDGTALTNGVLLDFKPMQLIKHSLFENDTDTVIAVLTYSFQENDGQTLLTGQEELITRLDQAEYQDAVEGWDQALNAVKLIAEAL